VFCNKIIILYHEDCLVAVWWLFGGCLGVEEVPVVPVAGLEGEDGNFEGVASNGCVTGLVDKLRSDEGLIVIRNILVLPLSSSQYTYVNTP
jgi:hypothetical protein